MKQKLNAKDFILIGVLTALMLSMIDASIDRVEEINQSPQIDIDGKEQTPDRLDIEMQDVSFSYGDKKVIDHVSLTIPQGTTTAIVGPSGSGDYVKIRLS